MPAKKRTSKKATAKSSKVSAKASGKLRELFDAIDSDGSGSISADELLKYSDMVDLDGMTPARVREMMGEADTDGDGEVDFDEFVEVMNKSKQWRGCATPSVMRVDKRILAEADGVIAMGNSLLEPLRRQVSEQAPLRKGNAPLATYGSRLCVRSALLACERGRRGRRWRSREREPPRCTATSHSWRSTPRVRSTRR